MSTNPDISVIAPIHNEEGNLPALYQRLTAVLEGLGKDYELILVNDGSRDGSMRWIRDLAAKDPRVKFIHLSRNFGHQIAVTAGLDLCRGNKVVIIDADLQDPPEIIPQMLAKMDEGFEVVYARRRSRKGERFLKRFTARLFYRLLRKLTHVDIPVDTGDFRVMDRKLVEALKHMPEQQKFLRGQIAWAGFRQTYVEYDRDERLSGKTKYTYRKMIRLALDGITSFSDFPLKFATLIGFFVSGIAFLLIIYALISHFWLHNTVQGWSSLIISVVFLGGIQLICIGIIGEYVARISANVRNRPLYLVADTNLDNPEGPKPDSSAQG